MLFKIILFYIYLSYLQIDGELKNLCWSSNLQYPCLMIPAFLDISSQFQFKVSVSASSDVKDQFDTGVPAPVQSVGGGCTGGKKCGM